MNRPVAKGVLLSFLAYSVYALSDASVKLLEGSLSPHEMVFFGALSGMAALPFLRRPGEHYSDIFRARSRTAWLARAIAAVIGSVGSVTAFTHLSMAEAFSLLFLMPTFVTIMSVLALRESVGWRRWMAVLMGFVGVLIVLRPGFRELGIGHLGAIAGGLSGAVTVVMLRAFGHRERRLSLYGAGQIGPILVSGLLMLPDFVWPSGGQWPWLLGYGLLAAAGNILVILASGLAPASLVAPAQYSQMIWAVALGYLVFGDHVDSVMGAGILVIVTSGVFTFMREKVRKPRGWGRVPPVHPQ
jgi:drug/metabolite transporter (DMT)-like permease